jgi:plasmid stabilization system protein ParE
MKFDVQLTSRAIAQLTAAADWWARHRSVDQADRWLEGFETAIHSLSENPQRHPLARENNFFTLPYAVHQLNYGLSSKPTHRALFEIRATTVYVVSIRHLAQRDLSVEDF